MGKAILRWRNKDIQRLVRNWKKSQGLSALELSISHPRAASLRSCTHLQPVPGEFVSYLLRETLWLHEEAEKTGRGLWIRCLLEVVKRWHYQRAVRYVGRWKVKTADGKSALGLAHANAVSGLKMMGKILTTWNQIQMSNTFFAIRRNYNKWVAANNLQESEAMKAKMMQMQEDELLSRVKKLSL